MIKTGRYGKASWAPDGVATPTMLLSINGWKLSLKQDFEDVTCYGDTNKVYIPGMRDVSGSLAGFWNSDALEIVEATEAETPGLLELVQNDTEAGFGYKGLAYLDADIDCTVKGAPKLASTFRAAGPWTGPTLTP